MRDDEAYDYLQTVIDANERTMHDGNYNARLPMGPMAPRLAKLGRLRLRVGTPRRDARALYRSLRQAHAG